jgi:hypothetical protein
VGKDKEEDLKIENVLLTPDLQTGNEMGLLLYTGKRPV